MVAQDGVAFEVKNKLSTPIRIDSLDHAFATLCAQDCGEVQLYMKLGPCDGLMQDSVQWTILGGQTLPHPAWPETANLPITVNVTLQPGALVSFYITAAPQHGAPDTNQAAYILGDNQYGVAFSSDANIEVIARAAVDYPFGLLSGASTAGGLWQGVVHYCPLDASGT